MGRKESIEWADKWAWGNYTVAGVLWLYAMFMPEQDKAYDDLLTGAACFVLFGSLWFYRAHKLANL